MKNTNFIGGRISAGCHMCGFSDLILVLNLGHQPHSDLFPTKADLDNFEPHFPLRLVQCTRCGLLQIDYYVDPEYLYQGDYLYQSSTTKTGRIHYGSMARDVVKRFGCVPSDLVVDIGSNVGVLLQGFKEEGVRVLGVDPAEVSREAEKNGIPTLIDFFDSTVAKNILTTHGKAKIITGTNVFAHLHRLDSATEGIVELLDQSGVLIIEAPHALEMVNNLEYDTIYHQHIGYLSVKPMKLFFEKYGLELFDVESKTIHGGTLRYYVGHKGEHTVGGNVARIYRDEEAAGLYTPERLKSFAQQVTQQKVDIMSMVLNFRKSGKRVAVVSTPAKGNTLLNYCHLDNDYIGFATERNQLKVGRFTPSTHIPIRADAELCVEQPDYALLLAWNFSDEIISNLSEYRNRGGKFIIPIPKPIIV